jgi:hypothetical protein
VSDIRVPGAPHGAAARETMTTALVVALVIFAGTLASLEAGFRWGRRETARNTAAHEGIGAVEASAFALLGLLLGFSFAGATARLEAKRELIVAEANAIGTPKDVGMTAPSQSNQRPFRAVGFPAMSASFFARVQRFN